MKGKRGLSKGKVSVLLYPSFFLPRNISLYFVYLIIYLIIAREMLGQGERVLCLLFLLKFPIGGYLVGDYGFVTAYHMLGGGLSSPYCSFDIITRSSLSRQQSTLIFKVTILLPSGFSTTPS